MGLWKKILILLKNSNLSQIAIDSRRQIFAFGVVLFINYPLYYVIWLYTARNNYENLPLRVIASLLCVPLIFNQYWSKKVLHFLTIYWYIAACYCLPFFFTFMTLKNNANALWLMNLVSATFFILLLFDVLTSLTLLLLGTLAGFLVFIWSGSVLYLPLNLISPIEIIFTLIPAILIGGIFSKNKQTIKESSRAKSEFIANMSHDIRTPLTGIINFSRYLKEQDVLTEAVRKELAEDTYKASEQLLKLLNGVLDVVSTDSETDNDVLPYAFDLFELLRDLIELETPAVKAQHLELRHSIDKRLPRYVITDRNKLHRILLNLMGNAIKFTEKGFVEISAKLLSKNNKKATIMFSVKDTGIGIPKESQNQIFERFFKVSPSYKSKYLGSGIGLHIVQKYVLLLGGKIKFHSIFGKGTTFSVTLHLPIAESAQKSPDKFYKKNLKPEKNNLFEKHALDEISINFIKNSNNYSDVKLLLVEDNLSALKALKLLLIPFELHIKEAQIAEDAFELVKKEAFDLIITDIGLPEMQGDELVKKIRQLEKQEKRSRGTIVALTGHAANKELVDICKKAGIDEVFQKPMEPKTLEGLLYSFMKLKSKDTNLCLNSVNSSLAKELIPSVHGKLGVDLPDTEAQLFEIDCHPLFDVEKAIETLGSKEIIQITLKDFRASNIDDDLENLKQSHELNDWKTVEKLAHKIKGGACYGTVRLYYALLYMERYIKAGHSQSSEQLYQQMLRVIDETSDYLEKYLRNYI